MESNNCKMMNIETVEKQRHYIESQRAKGGTLGIVFADAFLRGMRDFGYKSPSWSLAEVIDNSFQAAADTVSIRFGFNPNTKTHVKPDLLVISDNGNGMIPEMIGYAVRWGGTTRENDRKGFGRFGYGLPSSVVSLAKRYTVYSKIADKGWHAVTVDIEKLAEAAADIEKTKELLLPRETQLPDWVIKGEKTLTLDNIKSGTVIILEDIDRLRNLGGWIKSTTLKKKLLKDFGVIYRHWIPDRRIFVDGTLTEAVDPLFLMEHARFYNETPIRAQRIEARTFEVETSRGTRGTVSIRASYLPPNFQNADPTQHGRGAEVNKRQQFMRTYNGILICRGHRHIDCIQPRWTEYQHYDYNIKIEIDFDPELDEFFGMTTAKQQIVIIDEMWEMLKHSGKNGGALVDLIKDIRRRRKEGVIELVTEVENQVSVETPRSSVRAIEQTEKFKDTILEPTPHQKAEAEKNLEEQVESRARLTGQPKEEVAAEMSKKISKRHWDIEFDSIPEGPFYRPKRLGELKVLIINTNHPFYTKIYKATPVVRAGLEVLLIVLAERELEANDETEKFYKAERQKWSERMRHALDELMDDQSLVDMASAFAEEMQMGVMAG